MRKYLLLAILAVGTLATACKKKVEDPGPITKPEPKNAFTMTGADFDDYRFLISDDAEAVAAFDPAPPPPTEPNLQPIIDGPTTDAKYTIRIDGQWDIIPGETLPKTLVFDDKNMMNIAIEGIHSTTDTVAINLTSKMIGGSVTITKFGEVGQTIEGTFKGLFTISGGTEANIEGGKFVVKRDPNL